MVELSRLDVKIADLKNLTHLSPVTVRGFVRLTVAAALFCFSCRQEPPAPKALFIIVDGIPADVIEKLQPPVLTEIAKEGSYSRAYVGGVKGSYSETPTISAVGYNSLLTGCWVNKHNVWDNDIKAPNYHYRSIFRIAEESARDFHTAIFSTWTDNRTKLIGEGLSQTGNVRLDYKFDGLELDTVKYPHDPDSEYIHRIDEAVATEAAQYIRQNGPDLSWVYLQYTDDMGHRFGDSEQFYKAIGIADSQVGKVWDAVKKREKEFDEDWLIIVTTDHGRDSVSGKHHGGQSERERSAWIVTNNRVVNDRFKENPAIVDIMPSMYNHLNLSVPEEIKMEIDGVPFIGQIDFSDLTYEQKNGSVLLHWKSLSKDENAKAEVFVTQTNHFKDGGKDFYRKVAEARIADEKFNLNINSGVSFHKILLKGPNHYLNVWIK